MGEASLEAGSPLGNRENLSASPNLQISLFFNRFAPELHECLMSLTVLYTSVLYLTSEDVLCSLSFMCFYHVPDYRWLGLVFLEAGHGHRSACFF